MTNRHTPEVIAAAKRGHPDTITASKILVEALEDLESEKRVLVINTTAGWGRSTPRPRKFRKGEMFKSVVDLLEWLDGGGWVYQGTKPQHPSVISNMSLHTLRGSCAAGRLARAIRNPEPVDLNEPPF